MKIVNILVPDLPESVSDATVVTWHKKLGDMINCDDNIVDIETDKVMLEVSSPCNGILQSILEIEGKIVKSQQILGKIHQSDITKNDIKDNIEGENPLKIEKKSFIKEKRIEYSSEKHIEYLTPSIRRLLRINGIDNSSIQKIEMNSIIKNKNFRNTVEKTLENSFSENTIFNAKSYNKKDKKLENRVKMSRLRQKIAERLLESQKNTAMLTTFNEVNMQPVILLRKKYSESFEKKHGIRIGFMSFYVKAVVAALKRFPKINAYIDETDIVYHNNFDISIAIATPRGLITPVLRNADNMSMSEIEKKIKEFSIKGFENKINLDELIGGNFTITNGGVFGSLMSTPIINPPQTAILGMHLIQDRPMAINGKIIILPMMYLALSYDHRLIDGKESVSFLVTIKDILEDFTRILIDI